VGYCDKIKSKRPKREQQRLHKGEKASECLREIEAIYS
jgi:hypothetical protein